MGCSSRPGRQIHLGVRPIEILLRITDPRLAREIRIQGAVATGAVAGAAAAAEGGGGLGTGRGGGLGGGGAGGGGGGVDWARGGGAVGVEAGWGGTRALARVETRMEAVVARRGAGREPVTRRREWWARCLLSRTRIRIRCW